MVEWLSFIELLIINRQNILLYKIAEIEQITWIHNLNMVKLLLVFKKLYVVWSWANGFLRKESQRLRIQGIVLTLSVFNSLAGNVFLSVTIRIQKFATVDYCAQLLRNFHCENSDLKIEFAFAGIVLYL